VGGLELKLGLARELGLDERHVVDRFEGDHDREGLERGRGGDDLGGDLDGLDELGRLGGVLARPPSTALLDLARRFGVLGVADVRGEQGSSENALDPVADLDIAGDVVEGLLLDGVVEDVVVRVGGPGRTGERQDRLAVVVERELRRARGERVEVLAREDAPAR